MTKFNVYARIVAGKIFVGSFEADTPARAVWQARQLLYGEEFELPSPFIIEDEEISTHQLVAYPQQPLMLAD